MGTDPLISEYTGSYWRYPGSIPTNPPFSQIGHYRRQYCCCGWSPRSKTQSFCLASGHWSKPEVVCRTGKLIC